MFVTFKIQDNGGLHLELNGDDNKYPFTKEVDTHCEMTDRPKQPKLQKAGQWPVFTYAQNRIWHVEGSINRQTMAEYDAARLLLLKRIMPPATTTHRHTGKIITTDENGHTYTSIVTLLQYSIPVVPLYPSVGEYMIEWESDDPFVYDEGGNPVYI